MKKPITMSRKSYDNLLDAWSRMNGLCSYLANPEYYTKKYNPQEGAKKVCKKLDQVVAKLPS